MIRRKDLMIRLVKYSHLSGSFQRWMLTSTRNDRSMVDPVWGRQMN